MASSTACERPQLICCHASGSGSSIAVAIVGAIGAVTASSCHHCVWSSGYHSFGSDSNMFLTQHCPSPRGFFHIEPP
eukprot:6119405-Prymnesium_polylepis.1